MSSRFKKEREHAFSIDLKSKDCLKRVAIPNDSGDNVVVEGFLGKLEELDIIEDLLLMIKGTNGILRIELSKEELRKLLSRRKRTKREVLDDDRKE